MAPPLLSGPVRPCERARWNRVGIMYRCGQKRQREAKSRLLFTIQQYLVVSNGGLASPFDTIQSEGLFVRLLVWEIVCTSLGTLLLYCTAHDIISRDICEINPVIARLEI